MLYQIIFSIKLGFILETSLFLYKVYSTEILGSWYNDIQHNRIQQIDIQYYVFQYNEIQHHGIQQSYILNNIIQHSDPQYNTIQHNDTRNINKNMTLGIATLGVDCYAEFHLVLLFC